MSNRQAIIEEILRRRRDRTSSLAEFTRAAWPLLEPVTQLKWGWCLDAICEHLEAVSRGEITHLCMNVPPGSMKSLLTSVFWPAWEWGPAGLPQKRFVSTSHSGNLALRDNIKSRRLIKSDWYQARWPLVILDDQDTKFKFENEHMGFREAMAFTNMTGTRGDRVILDDPLSAEGANSDAERRTCARTFRETLPSRVNDDRSAIVVIMQRLHEGDPTGIILSEAMDYVHLMIPMRFEEERRCTTRIGWTDPRTKDGELMFPERFPESQVAQLEHDMGAYATAGQLQQRPAPRGGGMFQESWLEDRIVENPPPMRIQARGWDLAGTKKKSSPWTRGVKIGIDHDGNIWILDVKSTQSTPSVVEKLVLATAREDGPTVVGSLPQDPGQAGKAQVEYYMKKLVGLPYTASPESGDKETRARPLASSMEMGLVYMKKAPWNRAFIDEMIVFPAGKFADQVDAASRAFMAVSDAKVYTLENL